MTTELPNIRKTVNRGLAELAAARSTYRQESQAVTTAQQKLDDLRQAQALAQEVAQAVQKEAHSRIADIVSRSLEAIFDQPYQFAINFEQKYGRTTAALTFERGSLSVDPMTASGGGVVSVAAFALRLSCLLLCKPPRRRLLALDEPWANLSVNYRPRLRELLETLTEELDCQIILVTHSDELKIGKVYNLT